MDEQEIFIELGNALLRQYCNDKIQSVTGITKKGFLSGLIYDIAEYWKMDMRMMPDEQTFYRAFRETASAVMRERLALLYYAKTDPAVGSQMTKIFLDIAKDKRPYMYPHWSRYLEESGYDSGHEKKRAGKEQPHSTLETELQKAREEMKYANSLLRDAIEAARRKDEMIEQQFAMLQQQRIAGDVRVMQLEEEVRKFINMKSEPTDQFKLAEKYFVNGNYTAYQNTLDNGVEDNAKAVARTYYLKAKGFEATLQYQDALEAYGLSCQLQPQNPEYLDALGHFLYLIADYKASLNLLSKANAIVSRSIVYKYLQAPVLSHLGEVYLEKDDFDTAIKYFQKSLALKQKDPGQHADESAADDLNHLGIAWMDKAEYDKAIGYYTQALVIYMSRKAKYQVQIATVLSHMGMALKGKGDFAGAIKNYKEAIRMEEKTHGRMHPHVANYLNNIAEIWREQSKYDPAIANYEEAIAIYRSIFKNGHPRIAGFLNNLGAAWKEKGHGLKGISYYLEALDLNKKLFGNYHTSIGHNYNNLGLAYHELGENEKALESYREGLKVYKKLYKGEHPHIARVYSNMGGVYHGKGAYPMSLRYYNMAKDMYEKHFSSDYISIAFPIANIARVYDEQGKYDLAIEQYNIALSYFLKTLGDASMPVANVYNNLGQTWLSKGDRTKAVKYYKKALALFEKIVGPQNRYTIKCRKELKSVLDFGAHQ